MLQFIEPRRRTDVLDSLATTYDQAELEATRRMHGGTDCDLAEFLVLVYGHP